jgi:hypothetical protein
MPYAPPDPPEGVPDDVIEGVAELPPDLLRDLSRYAEALAEHREREARLDDESEREEGPGPADSRPDADRPQGVPAKATITVKEIHGNRYYYWQWRDGDTVTSKYEGPVDPGE